MKSTLTVNDFLSRYQHKLELRFASQKTGLEREIKHSRQVADTFDAAAYFNVMRTSSIVVVGFQEARYIKKLLADKQIEMFNTLFRGPVCVIICSHENALPAHLIELCENQEIPVLLSALRDSELLDKTRFLLNRDLADNTDEHGVFLEIYGLGVFITGNPAVGKSELALALISRGHRLIADDVTRFARTAADVVEGRSTGLLADFLEVRGLGVVNIRAMFGANSLTQSMPLNLIVNMVEFDHANMDEFDRLGNQINTRSLLGLEFAEVTLPVGHGRNLAILVETAARNYLLQANGYHAAQDFIERQRQAIALDRNRPN